MPPPRGYPDIVMVTSSEMAANGIIPVLSISPIAEDHCSLQHILGHLQNGIGPEPRVRRAPLPHTASRTCSPAGASIRSCRL